MLPHPASIINFHHGQSLGFISGNGRQNDSPTWGKGRAVASASPGSRIESLGRQGGESIGNHESISGFPIKITRKISVIIQDIHSRIRSYIVEELQMTAGFSLHRNITWHPTQHVNVF